MIFFFSSVGFLYQSVLIMSSFSQYPLSLTTYIPIVLCSLNIKSGTNEALFYLNYYYIRLLPWQVKSLSLKQVWNEPMSSFSYLVWHIPTLSHSRSQIEFWNCFIVNIFLSYLNLNCHYLKNKYRSRALKSRSVLRAAPSFFRLLWYIEIKLIYCDIWWKSADCFYILINP